MIATSIAWNAVVTIRVVLQSLAHDGAVGPARSGGARLAGPRRRRARRPAARSHARGDRDRRHFSGALLSAPTVPDHEARAGAGRPVDPLESAGVDRLEAGRLVRPVRA